VDAIEDRDPAAALRAIPYVAFAVACLLATMLIVVVTLASVVR
jgi:hypothetical protein